MNVRIWLRNWLRSNAASENDGAAFDADLAEEFDHHLALLREEEVAGGADAGAAAAHALRRFGDPAKHARACRRVAMGVFTMKRGLFIGWNVALALGLMVTFVLAQDAHRRAMYAGLPTAAPVNGVPSDARTCVLRAIWRAESGAVHVSGTVAKPGDFVTSLAKPMSIAQLLEMSGASNEATLITMRRPGLMGECYVSVENAYRYRDEPNLMPEPGTIVTIK